VRSWRQNTSHHEIVSRTTAFDSVRRDAEYDRPSIALPARSCSPFGPTTYTDAEMLSSPPTYGASTSSFSGSWLTIAFSTDRDSAAARASSSRSSPSRTSWAP